MGASHFSLPPLQQMFELEPRLMYGWYLTALVIGVVVYRRSGVVKDFEYNRAKAMRKIKHVYEAEEQGVWATDAHLDATMSPSTKHGLSRSVSEISGESPEMELGDEAKVEVQMLSEADHIVKANARVTGSATLDDETVVGTIGANRRISPMDRFLDTVFGLFGIDSKAEREAQRQARSTGSIGCTRNGAASGCAAALEQGEGRFGGEHDFHERFRRGGNRHQHLRANPRRVSWNRAAARLYQPCRNHWKAWQ